MSCISVPSSSVFVKRVKSKTLETLGLRKLALRVESRTLGTLGLRKLASVWKRSNQIYIFTSLLAMVSIPRPSIQKLLPTPLYLISR